MSMVSVYKSYSMLCRHSLPALTWPAKRAESRPLRVRSQQRRQGSSATPSAPSTGAVSPPTIRPRAGWRGPCRSMLQGLSSYPDISVNVFKPFQVLNSPARLVFVRVSPERDEIPILEPERKRPRHLCVPRLELFLETLFLARDRRRIAILIHERRRLA